MEAIELVAEDCFTPEQIQTFRRRILQASHGGELEDVLEAICQIYSETKHDYEDGHGLPPWVFIETLTIEDATDPLHLLFENLNRPSRVRLVKGVSACDLLDKIFAKMIDKPFDELTDQDYLDSFAAMDRDEQARFLSVAITDQCLNPSYV